MVSFAVVAVFPCRIESPEMKSPLRSAMSRYLLAAAAFLAVPTAPTTAFAQAAAAPETAPEANPPAASVEAEKVADEGREAYRGGKYAEAIALFERAYALGSKPAYLYNIARAKEKMATYDEAVKYLEKYLEAYKKQNAGVEPPNAADVKNLMRDLKQRAFEAMPEVTISSTPPGAQIYLGATDGLLVEGAAEKGALIGSTPFTTHLKQGTYALTLELINHVTQRAELQVPQSGRVNLAIAMKIKQSRSGLAVWANVKGAQIAMDGKIVAVTPFGGVLPAEPGQHQVTLTRVGYETADQQITLEEDKLTTLRVNLKPSHGPPASWRSFTGWPLMIVGLLGISGGYVARTYADKEYAGSPLFLQRQKYQNYGYIGGGTAVGLGLGLIIWDWTRSGLESDDLVSGPVFENSIEQKPLPPPEAKP